MYGLPGRAAGHGQVVPVHDNTLTWPEVAARLAAARNLLSILGELPVADVGEHRPQAAVPRGL